MTKKFTNSATLCAQHVAHNIPSLERQYLEQCEHGVADIVEIEIARIRPGLASSDREGRAPGALVTRQRWS
jgi:hypothetical protein